MGGAISWILAWIVMIMFLIILSNSKSGKNAIYYAAWLAVALLVVTHSNEISTILSAGQAANQ